MSITPPDPSTVPDYQGAAAAARIPTPGLSADQLREIALAAPRAKKVMRAVVVSKIDGGIMAFFAFATLASYLFEVIGAFMQAHTLAALLSGFEALLLGIALSVVAMNSFRGAARLKRFDRTAPASLAMNQCFLAASVILYAAYSLHRGLTGKTDLGQIAEVDPGMAASLGSIERLVYWAVYGGLIIGTAIAQGLTAIYYATRKKYLEAYLDQTPPWVVELQAARA